MARVGPWLGLQHDRDVRSGAKGMSTVPVPRRRTGSVANLRVLLAFFESCSSVGSPCPPGITQAPSSWRPNHGETVGYSSVQGV